MSFGRAIKTGERVKVAATDHTAMRIASDSAEFRRSSVEKKSQESQ